MFYTWERREAKTRSPMKNLGRPPILLSKKAKVSNRSILPVELLTFIQVPDNE